MLNQILTSLKSTKALEKEIKKIGAGQI